MILNVLTYTALLLTCRDSCHVVVTLYVAGRRRCVRPGGDAMTEREAGMTPWLFFSIAVCVFGNSFLYGYNIGAVNSPSMHMDS